ncbi:hypothetical protein [Sphingobacterium alkalisoli]|uniref:hypothetical protein n=1 Tax=Sphingobacterium alkalisoli TaxID=1874115 RepID=UPI001B805DC2|nr:hypothetical protein [Sphingobacterium alkalisoli]
MGTENKMVNVPKSLWKLHGKQAYKSDLILTYLLAIIVMFFNMLNAKDLALWEIIVIAVLSVDIGGGVVSNFTKSTISYYKEAGLSPHFFVWFHTLQTLALMFVYNQFYIPAAVIMAVGMTGASIAVVFRKTVFQLQISVFFFALVILLASFYPEMPIPLKTLLLLMSFKLMVGFAGHYGKYTNTDIQVLIKE